MNSRMVQLAIVVVAMIVCVTSVTAQTTTNDILVRAQIPFAFVAGGVRMPAGDYRIFHPKNPYVVVIEKADGRLSTVAYVHPSAMNQGETSTKLVFNRYGDQYFLAQVWTERNREAHQMFKCRAEQRLIAEGQKATPVAIAALR